MEKKYHAEQLANNCLPPYFPLLVLIAGAIISCGCGGGSGIPSSPFAGSPNAPGTGNSSFQPRPFPGDYFMRLPGREGTPFVPHLAYNPQLKELFVSNPDVNAVEVYSTVDGHFIAEIGVPGPAGLSFSSDYSQLVVGTVTPFVYFLDPAKLDTKGRIQVPASLLLRDQGGFTTLPVMPYAMSDGSILLGLGGDPESQSLAYTSVVHLIRYDPASNSFASVDPGPSGVTANPSRSLDGKFLVMGSIGAFSEKLYLYSTNTRGIVATSAPLDGFYLAANPNGSQYVCLSTPGSSASQLTFLGPDLQVQTQYTFPVLNPESLSPVYSRDGKYLYVMTKTGIVAVFNTQTGSPTGYMGVSVGSVFGEPQFFDVDEGYRLFGTAVPAGALVLNASQLQSSPPPVLAQFSAPTSEASPNVGPMAGGEVQFVPQSGGSDKGDGITSDEQAYFGATAAAKDTVGPYPASSGHENFLTATAPPASTAGPVTVLLTDANNNAAFLPDAFTYGPHLIRVEPNVASPQGGDQVTIFANGLGFGNDVFSIRVTVGGNPITDPPVLNSYASFNLPEQSLTIKVPPGTPGWADITVSTPNGSDTLKRGLEYLTNETHVPSAPYAFVVFDGMRNLFYLTGSGNNVAVFDPVTRGFLTPLQPPGVSSGAQLAAAAVTPDGSRLLVSDPTDKLLVIFDLTSGSSTTTKLLLSTDDPATLLGPPMSVVAIANNHALVSLTPCVTDTVREVNLADLTVTARPDAIHICSRFDPYPKFANASADGSTAIFSGLSFTGTSVSVWRYDATTDTFTPPMVIADAPWVGTGTSSIASDGSAIAVGQGMVDQDLTPLLPLMEFWVDSRLNDTGSVLYAATNGASTTNSILLFDTHNGRRLLRMGLPSSINAYRPLAIDSSGQKILASRQDGVSYFELSVVPLAVGSVSPAQTSSGMTIQLRGIGFVTGTAVKVGGQSASCTAIDTQTLMCTVPSLPQGPASIALTNPDGQKYSFEYAFTVQ